MARTWKDSKRYVRVSKRTDRVERDFISNEDQPRFEKLPKKRFHGCDRKRGRRDQG